MEINKILFITLSNIGDVILTLPVLDALRESFAGSRITVMVGPRPKEIFENNPDIDSLIIYNKCSRLREKIKLFNELRKERFDIVIDMRNSLFGALLPTRYRTSPFLYIPNYILHMKDRNLYRLQRALKRKKPLPPGKAKSLYSSDKDRDYVDNLLKENAITDADKLIIVSVGAGGDTRRWEGKNFAQLCDRLSQDYCKVILIGSKAYQQESQYIYQNCQNKIFDFTGLTTLAQVTYLLKKAALLITCDTGTLQLASYLDKPILALFGPSDEKRYGQWSSQSRVIRKEIFCRPCAKAHCKLTTVKCMRLIRVEDVLRQVRNILGQRSEVRGQSEGREFKRILITRTDRVGDVLLSTPVIKALREDYPDSYIAMMVSPYAKDIVEANPYLDEVIIYDKGGLHKSWLRSIKLARNLKKRKFDLGLILHPANRVHLITFFAAIPKRIGYDRKLGFLLSDKIKHTKQYGQKHELEYNCDLLSKLGIEVRDKTLFMPIKTESENWVDALFIKEGIKGTGSLLAIHSAASCPSKVGQASALRRLRIN